MPRITRVVIRPKIGQDERDQNVSNLVRQLKQYYRQTNEETLFNLAITIEKQAFGHAQTREQYSDNLKSLTSQETEKANQLYEEISGRITGLGNSPGGAGMRTAGSSAYNHRLIAIPCNGDSGDVEENLSEHDKRVKQKLARQRIIARQRKRMRPVSNSNSVQAFCEEAQRLEAEEHPYSKIEKSSSIPQNAPPNFGSRAKKRIRTDSDSSSTNTMEWYDRLFDANESTLGSSFLEELSASDFRISDDCDDIETCHSSTRSGAPTVRDLE